MVMVKKVWLRKKLKKLAKRKWLKNVENKDVQVFVTGVAMAGESQLHEHNRTSEKDKAKSTADEIRISREDDRRQGN
jgi:hypothetical protein